MAKSSSLSKSAVWVLLALLILGLAGFGATNLGGNVRTVGFVGDKPISTQSYFVAMQRELQAVSQQTGQLLTFAQAREIGLDQAVLTRLVTLRALDHEATEMGLSIGDANVRDQLLEVPAFQSLDGQFDREAYTFALEQQGLNESEFETTIREQSARTLLQGAVINGIEMPATFTNTLLAYAGEQRSFRWAILEASALDAPLTPATETELQAFYDENIDRFQLPETKRITFAWLTPDMIVDTVEVDEDGLRQAYQDRIGEFNQPERRLVERLVYLDETDAADAQASLEVGGTTFEALVEQRGLELADVDLGDVGRLELDAAGEAVFNAEVGDVVGPVPSSLGPALFRINGILPAQSIPFEEARAELRESVALDRARRVIEQQAESYDDLLAGGATLEELVAESDMRLDQIDWSVESGDGIAAYEDFRVAAQQLTNEDFPQIGVLEDGGLFAMRLEEELPARPEPFETARDAVSAALEASRTEAALSEQAELLATQLADGTDFAALGLDVIEEDSRTRGAFVPRTPPGFLNTVFEMEPGNVQVIAGGGVVTLVELTSIAPPDDTPEAEQLRGTLQAQLNQSLAQDLFDIYTNDVANRAQQRIDPQAIEAVNVNFP